VTPFEFVLAVYVAFGTAYLLWQYKRGGPGL